MLIVVKITPRVMRFAFGWRIDEGTLRRAFEQHERERARQHDAGESVHACCAG
jgi:hypothetical protein